MPRERKWSNFDSVRAPAPTAETGRGTVVCKIAVSDDYTPRYSLIPGFEYEGGSFVIAKFIPENRAEEFLDTLEEALDRVRAVQKDARAQVALTMGKKRSA